MGLTWACIAIVAASLLGGAVPLATILTHTRLQFYLSFAAGSMLGAVFLHVLPEAVHAAGSPLVLRWAALGLLGLFFLERFFAFHHHESPADPDDPCPTHAHEPHAAGGHAAGVVSAHALGGGAPGAKGSSLHWGMAAFGLAIHTIVGGLALASAAAAGPKAAAGVFLATLIHKPADSLTIVSLMLRAGLNKNLAHLVNFGFALMLPLGVGVFFLGSDWAGPHANAFTARVLAFSAGTFLCIALSDLLPELQFHEHDRVGLSAALLAGFGLMALAEAWG